ncbi:MAG: ABC transporter transmembrane domain-containing protein, partial [Chloroflexota bacterium]
MMPARPPSARHTLDELFLIRLRYSERGLVEARRDRPFVLNDAALAWVVYSGSVDLFAVQLSGDQPCGPRRHLWRVEAGEALFGMDLSHSDTGLLVVGGPGARLIRVPQAHLQELLAKNLERETLAGLVEGWVTALSRAIITALPAPDCRRLAAGPETCLPGGASAGPKKQVLWARPVSGASSQVSFCHLPTAGLPGEPAYLPLCKHTWVQAGQDVTLEVVETPQWLAQDPAWNGLGAFHSLAAGCLSANRVQSEQREDRRQQLKAEKSRSAVAGALHGMAAILERQALRPVDSSGALNALLAACQAVGEPQGIALQAPTWVQVERRKNDLLEAIAQVSGVRTRRVYLVQDWWRQDYGPLLGYWKREGRPARPVALLPGRQGYRMFDPADGSRTALNAELAAQLGELATMFYRPLPEEPLSISDLVRFGLHGTRRELGVMLSMAGLGSLLALLTPLATGWLFGQAIPNSDRQLLGFLALAWGGSALAGALFQVTGGLAQLRLESRLELSLEAALWSRLLALPAVFFRGFSAGDLAGRAFSISAMRRVLAGATLAALLSSLFSIFSLGLMFYYDVQLAAAALGLGGIALAANFALNWRQRQNLRAEMRWQGKISAIVLQMLSGIAKLRVAGATLRIVLV